MNEAMLGRNYKFKVEIRKNAKGNYGWRAVIQEDQLNVLEENIGKIQAMVEKKIKGWKE